MDLHLPARPGTVCWGYLDPAAPDRCTVPPGARLTVRTLNGNPEVLPPDPLAAGWRIPPELFEIHRRVADRVSPGHILTGPIGVAGALAGDVLAVEIVRIELGCCWAWTMSRPYGGALEEPAPSHLRHTRLDPATGTAHPGWGGQLELRPFFGVLGTAPPAEVGRVSSIPPRAEFGGNIDCKELVAGTRLYLPVHVPGAKLFVGDGHARQGDGECCGTALETSLDGEFRLAVIKLTPDRPIARLIRPRAESDRLLITLGFGSTLEQAARQAIGDMLSWLGELAPGLARQDAYLLLSVAADLRVTQLVNMPTKGAHVVLEKKCLPNYPNTATAMITTNIKTKL